MVRRYDQGESLARVGARLGFSGGTVRTHLIRAGVRLRDSHGRAR
nr:sigma factor-like helix-turn-helix DNA-binding protein [Gulosibacter sp. 10]